MLNSSNATDISYWPALPEAPNIIAGSILSIESLSGIALYLLVVYVLIKQSFFKEHPAYFIIISMAVSEVWLLLFFFFMGLMMISQNHFVPATALPVQTFFVNIPWTVDLVHINLLAFQRFAAIFGATKFPSLRVVFGEKFCKWAIVGAWLTGSTYFFLSYLLLPGWVTEVVDYKLWVLTPLYPEYVAQREIYWLSFNFTCIILSVLISIPTAVRVITKMRKTSSSSQVQRSSSIAPGMRTLAKEKILVYMTAVHTSVLLLNNVVMNVLSTKADVSWIRLICMCIFILDFFVTPVIYLSINKSLRKAVLDTFIKPSTARSMSRSNTIEMSVVRFQTNGVH